MLTDNPFLGKGWGFPPRFNKGQAEVTMVSGVEDIHQSLEIIFTTALGERIMNPTFGCNLESMLFEPMNASRITYLENLINTAILYHEPRIDADQIELRPDQNEGVLWIHIEYTVRATNSRFNFVYPYYLAESAP